MNIELFIELFIELYEYSCTVILAKTADSRDGAEGYPR
eukprot:SAG31_NODE_5399_length_2555_cov_1.499797_2_plen_38_part_00